MIKIEYPVFPSPEQWMFAIEGARNAYDRLYDHCQLDYELHLITHGGRKQIHIKLEQQDAVALKCTQFIKKNLT